MQDTFAAGLEFERHVAGLFGKEFRVKWMREATKEEVDLNPDLEVEHIGSGEAFGVECKYRASHYLGRLSWAKEYQLRKYGRYRGTGRRLFVVIGLGGAPDKPDYMYLIPAWQAGHTMLPADRLKRYRRDPMRKFGWDTRERRPI